MKMIKRTLIILIIATTIFTVVKCNRIEDTDNIKQEQGEDTLPKDDKEDEQDEDKKEEEKKDNQGKEDENKDSEQDKEQQDKNDEPKEEQGQEEIESPVELG